MSQIEDLVAAYRILAEHGVIDGYGHVSVRDERNPDRYIMARSLVGLRSAPLIRSSNETTTTLSSGRN